MLSLDLFSMRARTSSEDAIFNVSVLKSVCKYKLDTVNQKWLWMTAIVYGCHNVRTPVKGSFGLEVFCPEDADVETVFGASGMA